MTFFSSFLSFFSFLFFFPFISFFYIVNLINGNSDDEKVAHWATAARYGMIPLLTLMIVCLGILLFVWKRRRNDSASSSSLRVVVGALIDCYKPKFFFWELIVLARRLAIGLVVRLSQDDQNTAFALLVINLGAVAGTLLQPHAQTIGNRLDLLTNCALLLNHVRFAVIQPRAALTFFDAAQILAPALVCSLAIFGSKVRKIATKSVEFFRERLF